MASPSLFMSASMSSHALGHSLMKNGERGVVSWRKHGVYRGSNKEAGENQALHD